MALPVKPRISATTVASVNDTNSSTTLAAADDNRTGLWIFNDSTEVLYVKMGATASTTDYSVKILAGGFWEMPTGNTIYTGVVDGIWAANASGAAKVTKF